jgi:hypothetical protein
MEGRLIIIYLITYSLICSSLSSSKTSSWKFTFVFYSSCELFYGGVVGNNFFLNTVVVNKNDGDDYTIHTDFLFFVCFV